MPSEIHISLARDERERQVSDLLLAEYLALAAQGYKAVVDEVIFQQRGDFLLRDSENRSFPVNPQLAHVRAYLQHYGLTTSDVFAMLAGTKKCPTFAEILQDSLRKTSLTFPHHELKGTATLRAALNDIGGSLRHLFSRNPQPQEDAPGDIAAA